MASLDINAKFVAQDSEDNASKKSMIYIADSGVPYVVNMTENIGEVMGFADYTGGSTAQEKPASLKMRTISFKDGSGKVSGQYPVGTPTQPIYVEGGTIVVPRRGKLTGVTVAVIGAQGEKRRLQSANDTGQQSGTSS